MALKCFLDGWRVMPGSSTLSIPVESRYLLKARCFCHVHAGCMFEQYDDTISGIRARYEDNYLGELIAQAFNAWN